MNSWKAFSASCWLWRRRQWHPTPVLLPGKSHGRRSLVGCSPWDHWEWDTTEWLHFHFSLSCIGEGNGNPLQYSCWRIPGTGEPGGLPSMGSHRVGHDWSYLAAAAAPGYGNIFPSKSCREAWRSGHWLARGQMNMADDTKFRSLICSTFEVLVVGSLFLWNKYLGVQLLGYVIVKKLQNSFQSCTILHSHQLCMSDPVSLNICLTLVVWLFKFYSFCWVCIQ